MVGATAAATAVAPVREQVQCGDCGEFLNVVAGGPPRKCRFCGHEFYAAGVVAASEADVAFSSNGVPTEPMASAAAADDLDRLADAIQSKSRRD